MSARPAASPSVGPKGGGAVATARRRRAPRRCCTNRLSCFMSQKASLPMPMCHDICRRGSPQQAQPAARWDPRPRRARSSARRSTPRPPYLRPWCCLAHAHMMHPVHTRTPAQHGSETAATHKQRQLSARHNGEAEASGAGRLPAACLAVRASLLCLAAVLSLHACALGREKGRGPGDTAAQA